jgi:glycosyltransferase involved in cell wall biosynthesis
MPYLFMRGLIVSLVFRPNFIYLQDGMLAPIGAVLGFISRRPTILTLHGLDVTFKNPVYQFVFKVFAKHNTWLVAVSQATKDVAQNKTGRNDIVVINNGVRDEFFVDQKRQELAYEVADDTDLDLSELNKSKVLLSSGRLVSRKGVEWFVSNVMSELLKTKKDVVYLISGDGLERDKIESAIESNNLQKSVKVLGYVSKELRQNLYNLADLFIMPNIPVSGDMEGFGIVALEASSCGTPVVASALGGIKDAVVDGKNGYQVQPKNVGDFVQAIESGLGQSGLKKSAVREYTLKTFSWDKAASQYLELVVDRKRQA